MVSNNYSYLIIIIIVISLHTIKQGSKLELQNWLQFNAIPKIQEIYSNERLD